MKFLRLIFSFSFILAVVFSVFSQPSGFSVYPRRIDYTTHRGAREVGVFPFRGLEGFAGCGYREPRDLQIFDESQAIPRQPIAAFKGGKKIGAGYIAEFGGGTCLGFNGYASSKYLYPGTTTSPTLHSDTISVSFTENFPVEAVLIQGRVSTNYIITINDSAWRSYTSPKENDSGFRYLIDSVALSSLGFTQNDLRNVNKVSIKCLDPEWAFSLHGVYFGQSNGVGGGTNPLPPPSFGNPLVLVPGVSASELIEVTESFTANRWLSSNVSFLANDISTLALPSSRNIIATDIFHDQTYLGGQFTANFYASLLVFLTNTNNIGELYDVNDEPLRRTTAGCDISQDSEDPTRKPRVFVFAYDWRKNNAENAIKLKDYIGCVKRFHPGKKADIVAHSMGGLLSRRYILDNPGDHNVEKLVTIGTPWLGAPRAIHTLETGSFIASAFGSSPLECNQEPNSGDCLAKWTMNKVVAGNLRNVMQTFPAAMQLLPSEYYFNLNRSNLDSNVFPSPLAVKRFPWSSEADYGYGEMRAWLNNRHTTSPGEILHAFHRSDHNGLQDDWRLDSTTVREFLIYGQQSANITVGKVKATSYTVCNPLTLNCFDNEYFQPVPTNGDGTVPLLSSRRISFIENLNSAKSKRYIANAKTDPGEFDSTTEHTKLTENQGVHARLLKILKNQDSAIATPEDNDSPIVQGSNSRRLSPSNESAAFYLSLEGIEGFRLGTGQIADLSAAAGPEGSQAMPTGENSVWIAMPTSSLIPGGRKASSATTTSYSVAFFGNGSPMRIQVLKGLDYGRLESQVNYVDLVIPANRVAELTLSPFAPPELKYDTDGDILPDELIAPTIEVTDPVGAKDLEAPVVSFDYEVTGKGKTISLSATDNHSGVRKIYYSLDGQQFSEYSVPFDVLPGQAEVYVFAEDNNRNRTGIGPIDLAGRSYSIGNRVWFDTNNDGKINNDLFLKEFGADGVSVSLFADSDGNGQPDDLTTPLATTKTSDGYYRFGNLVAGNYVVRVNPSNFADGAIFAGHLNTSGANSGDIDSDATNSGENGIAPGGNANSVQMVGVLSNTISLGPNLSEPQGETDTAGDDASAIDRYADLTVDFGFYTIGLGGTIWSDGNGNGRQELNENGLMGFQARLFDSGGNEVPVGADGILGTSDDTDGSLTVAGVSSGADGSYLFRGLPTGEYSVKVQRQAAASSPGAANPNDNADADDNGNIGEGLDSAFFVSSPLALSPANRGSLENTLVNEVLGSTEDSTLDFGASLSPSAGAAKVSGYIKDQNGNGISRVKVSITNAQTQETQTTLSNQFGKFSIEGLPVGQFYLLSAAKKEYTFSPVSFELFEDSDFILAAD